MESKSTGSARATSLTLLFLAHDLCLSDQELLQHLVLRALPDRPLGHIKLPSQMIRVPLELLGRGLFLPVQDDVLKHGTKSVGDMIIDRLSVTVGSRDRRSVLDLNSSATERLTLGNQ